MTQRLAWLLIAAAAWAQTPAQKRLLQRVDARAERFGAISRTIWENPEIGFQERASAALLRGELAAAGFRIEENAGGMPTAFIASWGEGKPVIAILGEYDALPGLSQESVAEKKPRVEGAPGHGCGHNLFGAASALAAIAVKEQMTASGRNGTVRFYGTPAEEGGAGKVYLIRAGVFRDVDAALVWHPANANQADANPWLANVRASFRFYGMAAHAAASPELGRSALHAVELMSHAVNLLREHVPQETRIHYIVTKGGSAANIVPDFAEAELIARHPDAKTLDEIFERVVNCARAGAMATETRMDMEVQSAYTNILLNPAMTALVDRNLRIAGGVTYTDDERAFAEAVRKTIGGELPPLEVVSQVLPPKTSLQSASTDVGDVSWVLPVGQLFAAAFPPGVPFHSWQSTAIAGSSIGRKGMMVAARTLALAAMELFDEPPKLAAAKSDFEKQRGGREYRSLLPQSARP